MSSGEPLCELLLRGEETRREVGCQWESPEEETRKEETRKEVGCQSDSAERRDAAVQNQNHQAPPQEEPPPSPEEEGPPLRKKTPKQSPVQRGRRRGSAVPDPPQEEEEEEEGEGEEEEEEEEGDPIWTPAEGDDSPPPASPPSSPQLDSDSQHAPLRPVKLEPGSTMCEVCGKVMKNKASLARHSFIHTGQKPFACHLCELRFNRRDNLQHHLTRLHPEGAKHRQKHRPAPAWLCSACGKTFSCRSRLKTHEVIHSGVKPFRCDLCPKAYMRTNDLEHHKKIVHVDVDGGEKPPPVSSLLCDFCGKEFPCRSQLAVHFQVHTGERPHLCDICGRKFGRQYQLNRHKILVHNNTTFDSNNTPPDAPFPCSVCGKRLKSEALLAAHSRIHSAERTHRCVLCPRSFHRAASLKQHHDRVHLRNNSNGAQNHNRRKSVASSKEFPCSICGKVFKFRSLLSSHALIHSDQRPYGCDFCSRSFRRLGHLKRHREVVHANGERPAQSFVCHICGKDKKCRSQLQRHVIIHTGERPHGCELCGARFNRSGNLQQHRKRMHGEGGGAAEEEESHILFDDDMMPALAYKQEETVLAVDNTICEEIEEQIGP
ncbi:Zinc finger protein 708 [Dissostichus eleginoides]|uniref:Zinc finger protein 708 n=1 Tax=Dissostichus eleginoides TaxID=100907 RepID=A0AAD9BN22_DISEL|nr:Zinc finger protein 708 [Dissostichus eleginoides]